MPIHNSLNRFLLIFPFRVVELGMAAMLAGFLFAGVIPSIKFLPYLRPIQSAGHLPNASHSATTIGAKNIAR